MTSMRTDEQLYRDYGVRQTNGMTHPGEFDAWRKGNVRTVGWEAKGLTITRLRLLSDPGFPWWDVSYCYGMIGNEPVRVGLPFSQLPKRGMRKAIVEYAKRENIFIKATGIFDSISTLC